MIKYGPCYYKVLQSALINSFCFEHTFINNLITTQNYHLSQIVHKTVQDRRQTTFGVISDRLNARSKRQKVSRKNAIKSDLLAWSAPMHVSTPDEDVYNSRGSLLYPMSPLFSRPFCFFKIIITYLELSFSTVKMLRFYFLANIANEKKVLRN